MCISVGDAEKGRESRRNSFTNINAHRARSYSPQQLLRLIVAGDAMNLMHKDIKLENVFVRNAGNLQLAELALGDFGGAQNGRVTVNLNIASRNSTLTFVCVCVSIVRAFDQVVSPANNVAAFRS